jgi:hypothetical protein
MAAKMASILKKCLTSSIIKEIFMKKYEFTGKTKEVNGIILKQIIRLSDGMIGGWIEKEENLSQEGSCFVFGSAIVYGNARVAGNAEVYGNAYVSTGVFF